MQRGTCSPVLSGEGVTAKTSLQPCANDGACAGGELEDHLSPSHLTPTSEMPAWSRVQLQLLPYLHRLGQEQLQIGELSAPTKPAVAQSCWGTAWRGSSGAPGCFPPLLLPWSCSKGCSWWGGLGVHISSCLRTIRKAELIS